MGSRVRSVRRLAFGALVAAGLVALPARPAGHEIPVSVIVHALVKPEGDRLRVLVRAPLTAMRDTTFPLRGAGFLDLSRAEGPLRTVAKTWIAHDIELYENGLRLESPRIVIARVSLPSDGSFISWDVAMAHLTGPPLPAPTELPWDQALFDVLLEFPIRSEQSNFSVRPGFERLGLRVTTVLRFVTPAGVIRAFEFTGDPGIVRLDPRWHQAARRFIVAGFFHILDGTDHLLFLLCLVIPFRRIRPLVLIVTSFTLAHSITLIASAFGLTPSALWFPTLVETLIAISIVYMALENIVDVTGTQRRWMIAFAFGLVHGFGFSFALRGTLQFAGSHLLTSLLSFNLGVELGQLVMLAVFVPAVHGLFRFVVAERMGTIILSALIAHSGWHWMTERGGRLGQYEWSLPDATQLASALRWAMLLVTVATVIWWIAVSLRQRSGRSEAPAGD